MISQMAKNVPLIDQALGKGTDQPGLHAASNFGPRPWLRFVGLPGADRFTFRDEDEALGEWFPGRVFKADRF